MITIDELRDQAIELRAKVIRLEDIAVIERLVRSEDEAKDAATREIKALWEKMVKEVEPDDLRAAMMGELAALIVRLQERLRSATWQAKLGRVKRRAKLAELDAAADELDALGKYDQAHNIRAGKPRERLLSGLDD